ncbi:hypothetical protein K435DRAFT_871317 [Dendrothele bispora CBS 962.96]|uniref:Uncharacterized protein n=1 Tax=Dendrothele bispora (strain CBS 962.96) TaxID=1314807 RepID=A0A4S8L4T9_DENBC|nr:hypothetical protein K435DRAFT_871317 [Dendrothele bispora CBS 962.96]
MNLPPEERFLPKNTFFVCMIPGPGELDAATISHVLEPIVETLLKLWDGKVFFTHRFPGGITHRVAMVPLIADLPAIRLVSGFLSHSATMYCSWCKCTEQDRADLIYDRWEMRNAEEVTEQARTWLGLNTQSARQAQEKKTVPNLILGYMHNTLEGILQYHLRDLWQLGPREAEKEEGSSDSEDEFDEDELDDIARDVDELSQETEEFEQASQTFASAPASTSTDVNWRPVYLDRHTPRSQSTSSAADTSSEEDMDHTPSLPASNTSLPPASEGVTEKP